jgi:PhnB protein
MAKAANPIPKGFRTLTPHLTIKGGAAEFMEFIKRAFSAEEVDRATGPGGKLMHATARIGDSMLMFNDEFPGFGEPIGPGPWPLTLHLYVPDADALFAQATAAGCTVVMPLADQFWGERYGLVNDPFGFRWAIATRKEDLTPAEQRERQAKLFGGAGA